MKYIIIGVLFLLLINGVFATDVWTDLSDTDAADWVSTFTSVNSLAKNPDGNIYTGLNSGKLGRYSPTTNTWVDLSATDAANWAGDYAVIQSISIAQDNNVYTAISNIIEPTNPKFGKYSPKTNVWTDLSGTDTADWASTTNLYGVTVCSDGNVYTSMDSGKFGKYSPKTNVWTDLSATDTSNWNATDLTWSIFCASDGNVYTGSSAGKLGRYSPTTNTWTYLLNPVTTQVIYSLTEANGGYIYVGLQNGYFGRYTPNTNTWTNLSTTDAGNWNGSYPVNDLYKASDNNIYTIKGYFTNNFGRYSPTTNVWENLSATDTVGWSAQIGYSLVGNDNNIIFTGLNGGKFGKFYSTVLPITTLSGCTSGWHNSNQTITLTCNGNGYTCTATNYRIDSTGAFTNYTAPFVLSADGNYKIDYNSTSDFPETEITKTSYCAIDKTAPSVGTTTISGFTLDGTQIWGTGNIYATASDTVSGINTCQYTINNGSSWASADKNATHCYKTGITITAGTNPQFNLRATDVAGTTGTGTATIEYTADNVKPVTTFAGATGAWEKTTLLITLSCADAVSGCANIYYRINSAGAYALYSGAFGVSDGNNKIDYYSIDNAGNTEVALTNYAAQDRVAPTTTGAITAGTLGSNGWYTSNVTYTITPADATSGVKFTYYCIDTTNTCTPTTTYSSALTLSTESATNYVRYYSGDNANNNQSIQSSGAIKIDKTSPITSGEITAGTEGNNDWYISNVTYTITPADITSGVASTVYCTDTTNTCTPTTTYSSALTLSTQSATNYVRFRSTDNAGKVQTIQSSGAIKIDKTAPTTTGVITSGTLGNNGWYKPNVGYTITPTDVLSNVADTNYCIDTTNSCTPNLTYSSTVTISTESATNYVRFRSIDNAGNIETTKSSGTIKIDKTNPSVGTVNLIGFTIVSTNISGTGIISTTRSDALSGINNCEYTTNNGSTWTNSDMNTTHCYQSINIINNRNYIFNFRATDNAGNVGTGTASSSYVGKDDLPTTDFINSQINGTFNHNLILECVAGIYPCKAINFRINNGDWNYYVIGDNPLTIFFESTLEQDNNIQYFSTDNADNNEATKLSYFPMFKSENELSNSRIKLTGVTNYNGYTITSWLYQVNGTPLSGTTDRIKYYSTQSNQDLNVCLTTNNTDTICQSVFTWDTINPIIDANIKTSGYGFTNTFDINYNLTCNDNFPFITYKVIWANNGTTITLDEQYLETETLLQGTLDLNAGQEATLTFTCTDASNNQATYTAPTQYAIQFNIVDETTGLPFDLTKVTHAQAYTYDGNYLFNFKDTNNATQTYWSPTSVIRFDFTYPDEAQTKISREINFDYIDDANVPVCAAEYQQFYLYRFLSTTEKPIILYNDFANCYSLASTTKFLWTTYLTNTAYTINKPYYLYTYSNGVKSLLAILDGANNTEINLDILQFNQAQYQFDVASDSIVFRPGENDSNTIVFYFFSPNNNTWVNLEIYDQANNLLWDYLENTDTNSFQVTFFYGDLDINSDDLLKIVVTVLNDGDTTTFFKYFNTKGEAYAGLLNPIVAIVLSFFVLFFGITMVSYRFAMGWFGIVISFLAIGILALAPLYDYVLFLMAIYFIIGLFIGLIGREQTLGVN